MSKSETEFSRVRRKTKKSRSDWFLNSSIAVVVLLIIVTVAFMFSGDDEVQKAEENAIGEKQENKDSLSDEDEVVDKGADEADKEGQPEKDAELKEDHDTLNTPEEPGTLTQVPVDDKVVAERIVDTAWEPFATKQTGEHVSIYDEKSIDYQEKKEAIAYATGNTADDLVYWSVKNGGSPKKSIGIVSTHDKSKKYRVYIEWVEQKGWKPVQVDVLNTLDL